MNPGHPPAFNHQVFTANRVKQIEKGTCDEKVTGKQQITMATDFSKNGFISYRRTCDFAEREKVKDGAAWTTV